MKIIVWIVILFIMLGCSYEIATKIMTDLPEFIQQPFDFEALLKEFLIYLPLLGIISTGLSVIKLYLLKPCKTTH